MARSTSLSTFVILLYSPNSSGCMSDIHSGGTTFDFRIWHMGETWPTSNGLFIFGRISRPDRFQICSLITSMVVRCKWDTELCTENMVPQVFVQTTWNSYNGGGNTHFLNSLWTSGQNVLPRHWGSRLSLGIDLGPRHYQHHTLTIWGSRPTGSGLKHLQEKPQTFLCTTFSFTYLVSSIWFSLSVFCSSAVSSAISVCVFKASVYLNSLLCCAADSVFHCCFSVWIYGLCFMAALGLFWCPWVKVYFLFISSVTPVWIWVLIHTSYDLNIKPLSENSPDVVFI